MKLQRKPKAIVLVAIARAFDPAPSHEWGDCGRAAVSISSGIKELPLNVRYALIVAVLFGSTLLAQGEPLDREKWVGQTGRANRTCLAKFRQKFGGAKDHDLG